MPSLPHGVPALNSCMGVNDELRATEKLPRYCLSEEYVLSWGMSLLLERIWSLYRDDNDSVLWISAWRGSKVQCTHSLPQAL